MKTSLQLGSIGVLLLGNLGCASFLLSDPDASLERHLTLGDGLWTVVSLEVEHWEEIPGGEPELREQWSHVSEHQIHFSRTESIIPGDTWKTHEGYVVEPDGAEVAFHFDATSESTWESLGVAFYLHGGDALHLPGREPPYGASTEWRKGDEDVELVIDDAWFYPQQVKARIELRRN